MSMENATGAKKKEKPTENLKNESLTIVEAMDLDPEIPQSQSEAIVEDAKEKEVLQPAEEAPSEMVREVVEEVPVKDVSPEKKKVVKKKEEVVKEKTPVKKTASKGKTIDLAATIKEVAEEAPSVPSERKNSLPEENLTKPTERRRSRIFETAEKFQNMANQSDRPKKFVVPGGGGSSGGFKRDSERRASVPAVEATEKTPQQPPSQVQESSTPVEKSSTREVVKADDLQSSDSKGSVQSFSLEEARKSMENSIALLNQVTFYTLPPIPP